MAFAFVNIFESSIASKIHDYARLPSVITVRVIYQNHPLVQEEIYEVTLPRDACAADLQRYMAEIPMFKQHHWKPCEMDFYVGGSIADTWRIPLGEDDILDDSRPLHLHLVQRESPSDDDDDDTPTHLDSDESDTEDEDDSGPWRIGTSMRRALHWELLR